MSKLLFKGKVKEGLGGRLYVLKQRTVNFPSGGSVTSYGKPLCTLDTLNLSVGEDKKTTVFRENMLTLLSKGGLSNKVHKFGKNKGVTQYAYTSFNYDNFKDLVDPEFVHGYCTFFDNIVYTVFGVMNFAFPKAKTQTPPKASDFIRSERALEMFTEEEILTQKVVNDVSRETKASKSQGGLEKAYTSAFPEVRVIKSIEIKAYDPEISLDPESKMFLPVADVNSAGEKLKNSDLIELAKEGDITKSHAINAVKTASECCRLRVKNAKSGIVTEQENLNVSRTVVDPNKEIFHVGLVVDRGFVFLAKDKSLNDYSETLFKHEGIEIRFTNVVGHFDNSKIVTERKSLVPITLLYSNKDTDFIEYFSEEGRGVPHQLHNYRFLDFTEGSGKDMRYITYLISNSTMNLILGTDVMDIKNIVGGVSSVTRLTLSDIF